MALVTARMSISVDGFTAGPDQSTEDPFGKAGMRLTEWQFETDQEGHAGDAEVFAEAESGNGAHIMGRNMFGPGRGDWDLSWQGWWGDEPPYHAPVFVLTHYEREPLPMAGGTTFHFVTDGPEAALERARAAAGDQKIAIAGGANTVRTYLSLGAIDELLLHIAPCTLGKGERPLDNVGDLELRPIQVVASPTVTHIRYRVLK